MRAKEFLQEKSVTKTGFNQIMADANNRLGFECEIIVLGDYTTVRDTDQMSWDEFSGYLSISNNELNRIKEENTKNFLKKKWYKKVAGADEYDEENEDGDTRFFLRWLHSDEAEVLRHHYTYDKMIEQYGGNYEFAVEEDFLDLEPGYSWDGRDIVELKTEQAYTNLRNEIGEFIDKNIEIFDDYHQDTKALHSWYIEPDGSIKLNELDGVPAEIVSSVYSIADGLAAMEKLFRYIGDNHATNDSTGMHINLSREGVAYEDYDFLKMMIFFDENYTARLFERMGNEFCAQMRHKILLMIARTSKKISPVSLVADPSSLISGRDMPTVLRALKAIGLTLRTAWEKHSSFSSREGVGAFEFRSIGGEGYEKRFDEIKRRVINMANILKIGSDDSFLAKEYITKVFLILEKGKFSKGSIDQQLGRPVPEVPYHLNAFDSLFRKMPDMAKLTADHPAMFVSGLSRLVKHNYVPALTVMQRAQLRRFILRAKITADDFSTLVNVGQYNVIADVMDWPISTPTQTDQGTLPFAKGHATNDDLVALPDDSGIISNPFQHHLSQHLRMPLQRGS